MSKSKQDKAKKTLQDKSSLGQDLTTNPDFVLPEVLQEDLGIIRKKLAKSIDKILEEVQVAATNNPATSRDNEDDVGVLLFSSSRSHISAREMLLPKKARKQKRPELKRKRHVDGSESEDEDEKLRSVAVSADWVKTSKY